MAVTAEAILDIIASESAIDRTKLSSEATLESLDINSLDVASIVFELEDRFDIVIEPDAIRPDFTVGAFVAHIEAIAEAAKPAGASTT